jgi:hypothetical protein
MPEDSPPSKSSPLPFHSGSQICVDSGPKLQAQSADCPRIEEDERELKKQVAKGSNYAF